MAGDETMIACLTGTIKAIHPGSVVLDVGGVGYEVCVSGSTLTRLAPGAKTQLDIYTHVREDTLKLYGFAQALEKQLFLAFIGISGVGPKMALAVLSAAPSLESLTDMIEKENITGLAKLPRVGKKTAQQIVLALKGRVPLTAGPDSASRQWLHSALLNLGFKPTEIKMVLDQISPGADKQKDLQKALSCLHPPGL